MAQDGAPVVSVVMTARDQERFIEAAIDSITAQTFAGFELIVIDDYSTDMTRELATQRAKEDPRIVVACCAASGRVACLNHALTLARGRYVAIMDADDLAAPERLALQAAFLDQNTDVVAVGAALTYLRPEELRIPQVAGRKVTVKPARPESRLGGFFPRPLPIIHSATMFRRDAMLKAGGYRAALKHQEDTDLFLRLEEAGDVRNLPDILHYYRQHPDNTGRRYPLRQTASWVLSVLLARRRRRGLRDWADAHGRVGLWLHLASSAPGTTLHAVALVALHYARKRVKHRRQRQWLHLRAAEA